MKKQKYYYEIVESDLIGGGWFLIAYVATKGRMLQKMTTIWCPTKRDVQNKIKELNK